MEYSTGGYALSECRGSLVGYDEGVAESGIDHMPIILLGTESFDRSAAL
ncbi:protein of unknown function [Paenibacillus alvei]|uniref:Uncharacterized protein n=1 Tax=Paenibacillus alvei TaxID=44250 RepID=A0A383R508_PAEAL|nr:protein of unknown function [Paenibacillus alvei]